jgi:hypothetical protein
MINDPRAEPQYGERVPYVVRTGAPGARLIDRVVSPEDMLKDKLTFFRYVSDKTRDMRLDAEYYISKTLIPPLERIFNLVGANVRSWYEDMPKGQRSNQKELYNIQDINRRPNTATLHSFIRSRLCAICRITEVDEGISREYWINFYKMFAKAVVLIPLSRHTPFLPEANLQNLGIGNSRPYVRTVAQFRLEKMFAVILGIVPCFILG